MQNVIFAVLFSLSLSVLLCRPMLLICKKLGAKQSILKYVTDHKDKEGTATMGGLIFLIATCVSFLIFLPKNVYTFFPLFVMLSFGLLGFLDDFIKVRSHHNEGLLPYQKLVGQVGIALFFAIFVFKNCGSEIDFFGTSINLGALFVPFVVFVVVATTNSVNLTDGLDGLASLTAIGFLLPLSLILTILGLQDFALQCLIVSGAVLGFLVLNIYPAKIFMGDCGSLALGGFISAICCMCKVELLIAVMGIMFVLSAVSDIIQVAHFKRTGKRIFLMAPLHHHFQKKGVNENKITIVYFVITFAVGLVCVLLYL